MKIFMAVVIAAITLTGCTHTDPTQVSSYQMPAKLYKNADELKGISYQIVGSVSGDSCQLARLDPPADLETAKRNMMVRANRLNANAVILNTCQMMGSTSGCNSQAVCMGQAIIVNN